MIVSTENVTPLFARGFAALPYPRQVRLSESNLILEAAWPVALGAGVTRDDVAAESYAETIAAWYGETPGRAELGAGTISLEIAAQPFAAEGIAPEILRQGYRITIAPDRVVISGQAAPGLYYGVQTLLQLFRRDARGRLELPLGEIADWPEFELRSLHYDTKHHQERLPEVKRLIERAAHFKINAIAWEIEDKFAYRSHPLVGAPGAFTREELREITAYALRRHVEIIPILQGPSHLAFLLKHEKYAHLREDVRNNYMICPSREESFTLLFEMYDELIEATPGCRYIHVGTDEPYFLGEGVSCGCRARRDAIGAGGMMAEYIARCTKHLAAKGRTVFCWGESPMNPPDVARLPRGIVNAVYQNLAMSEQYRAHGIRELIYCPVQGERPLFPEYASAMGSELEPQPNRVRQIFQTLTHSPARSFDPLGCIIAAWDDSGLNLETFWLGYALGASYGWSSGRPGPEEATAQFLRLFHGPETSGLAEAYRLLDGLAHFWSSAWDRAPSTRGPSYKRQWHPRWDRTLALPNVPDAGVLDHKPFFAVRYAELLAKAKDAEADAERAAALLLENRGRARRNTHALDVFLTIANHARDHARLLRRLAHVERLLDKARDAWGHVQTQQAAGFLRKAAELARATAAERECVFAELTRVWERARLPKGMSADGRTFVHVQDNTKNHEGDWTADLGYLVKASRELELDAWAVQVEAVAAEFLRLHPETGKPWRPSE